MSQYHVTGGPCAAERDCWRGCASYLRHVRLIRGLRLRRVAEALDMDPTQLSRVERQLEGFSDEAKRRVAGFYHLPVGALFFGEDRMTARHRRTGEGVITGQRQ